jgi:hypothetical protein
MLSAAKRRRRLAEAQNAEEADRCEMALEMSDKLMVFEK